MRFKLVAKDAMSSPVTSIDSENPVFEAAKLMKQKNIGTIVITLQNRPVGIVTEKDIVQRLVADGKDPQKVKIGQIMTAPLMVASPESDLNEIAKKMADKGVRRVPIVDKGKIIGIVTERDVLKQEPQLIDAMKEVVGIRGGDLTEAQEPLVGICEECDNYSETLRVEQGRFLCAECRGE